MKAIYNLELNKTNSDVAAAVNLAIAHCTRYNAALLEEIKKSLEIKE